jgi:hypothetical protein
MFKAFGTLMITAHECSHQAEENGIWQNSQGDNEEAQLQFLT